MAKNEVSGFIKRNNKLGLKQLKFSSLMFCEREERRLRVFENKVLRRIFGPRRDEVTEDWRRLHNEEINVCTPHPISCG